MTETRSRSITCDNCGKELLTDTSYPHKWSLKLESVDTNRNTSGDIYGVHMLNPMPEAKHFCGVNCLAEWGSEIKDNK